MHGVEIGQAQKHLPAKRLQPTGGVIGIVVQERRAQPIGQSRADPLGLRMGVLDPLTCDKPDAGLVQKREQRRQKTGVILTVAIQGRDQGGARGAHPSQNRGALAAALSVDQTAKKRMALR